MRWNWLPIAVVAALGLCWFGWASWDAARQDGKDWRDIRQWAASHRPIAPRRPELLERSPSGEAFSHYARAAAVADRVGDVELQADTFDGPQAEAFLQSMRPALDHLEAGARSPHRRAPTVAELATDDEALPVLPLCQVARAAGLSARADLARGAGPAAVDRMLATLALAIDVASTPTLVAELAAVMWIDGVVGVLDDDVLRSLPPAELERLARAFAELDAVVPPTLQGSVGEVFYMLEVFQRPQTIGYELLGALRGFGAQDRAALLRQRIDQLEALAAVERAPWPERDRVYRQGRAVGDEGLARLFSVDTRRHELQKRRACDRWRQLRLALGVHLGTGPERLPDPLGGGELVVVAAAAGHVTRVGRTEPLAAGLGDGDEPPGVRSIRVEGR